MAPEAPKEVDDGACVDIFCASRVHLALSQQLSYTKNRRW